MGVADARLAAVRWAAWSGDAAGAPDEPSGWALFRAAMRELWDERRHPHPVTIRYLRCDGCGQVTPHPPRGVIRGVLRGVVGRRKRLPLLVRPDIIARWHRNPIARHYATVSPPRRRGRPPTLRSIRTLILRLAPGNSSRGYRRIHGELLTLTGTRMYILAVIEHATRRIRILSATANPTTARGHPGQRHLLHAPREYEAFYNAHRPHQGTANARPPAPLPEPITDLHQLAQLRIRRRDRLGGLLHEYKHAA